MDRIVAEPKTIPPVAWGGLALHPHLRLPFRGLDLRPLQRVERVRESASPRRGLRGGKCPAEGLPNRTRYLFGGDPRTVVGAGEAL